MYDVYATMYRTGLALALELNVVNKRIYVCRLSSDMALSVLSVTPEIF